MSEIQEDLIFDLGMHKGLDTEYYLEKGFRVVGLEAVPELAEACAAKLARYGDRLVIVNKALFEKPDEEVSFYTVPNKNDWGSLHRGFAEKGVETAVEITVQTIDLPWLLDRYGTPRYIKCDMEGADLIFLQQFLGEKRRPRFVSVEMNNGEEGEILRECGYEVGQIVNQWMHAFRKPPTPPREGNFASVAFNGEMSGLFGLELESSKWIPLDEVVDIYRRWKGLYDFDNFLAPGWLDLHAARRTDLS